MIAEAALAVLWLGAGFGVAVFVLAMVRLPPSDDCDAVRAYALVAAALSLPGLLFAPSAVATGIAACLLVAGLAIAVVVTSRLHRPRSALAARLIAGLMVAAAVMLFARARTAGVDAEMGFADRLGVAASHCGLAALAVAAIFLLLRRGQPASRIRLAVRPWLLAAWLLLTLALLVGSMRGAGVAPVPAMAGWVAASAGLAAISWRDRSKWSLELPQSWGAAFALGGVALTVVGLLATFALAETRSVMLHESERSAIGPWLIQLNNVTPAAGPGWVALEAEIEASRGAGAERLEPQQRFALRTARARLVPATRALWIGQLSASLERGGGAGGWPIRMRWRPFTGVAWAGLGLALLGGLVIALARGLRVWRRRPDPDWRRRSYA